MSQRGSIGINGVNSGQSAEESAEPEQAGNTDTAPDTAPDTEGHKEPPRKPKSEREKAFDFGSWLLEGLVGLSEELRHNDLGLPEDFWVHAYAARKETLLATRALVDAALDRCAAEEKKAARTKKKPPKRGQVSIDFD